MAGGRRLVAFAPKQPVQLITPSNAPKNQISHAPSLIACWPTSLAFRRSGVSAERRPFQQEKFAALCRDAATFLRFLPGLTSAVIFRSVRPHEIRRLVRHIAIPARNRARSCMRFSTTGIEHRRTPDAARGESRSPMMFRRTGNSRQTNRSRDYDLKFTFPDEKFSDRSNNRSFSINRVPCRAMFLRPNAFLHGYNIFCRAPSFSIYSGLF